MNEPIRDAPSPKIGAGALAAMGRQGLNELRAIVMPDSNVVQPTEAGAIGTATPGEVAQARAGEPMTAGLLGDRIAQMYGRGEATAEAAGRDNLTRESTSTRGREPREPEPE